MASRKTLKAAAKLLTITTFAALGSDAFSQSPSVLSVDSSAEVVAKAPIKLPASKETDKHFCPMDGH